MLAVQARPVAGQESAPVGAWLTEHRDGVISIFPCDGELCGRIVGMAEPNRPDGTPARDPQGHPQCGLTILRVTQTAANQWTGHVTDPDNGTVWQCELWDDEGGRLHLRGYVLLPALGETQVWTRYHGSVGTDCRMDQP